MKKEHFYMFLTLLGLVIFFSCSKKSKQDGSLILEINPQDSKNLELNAFCSSIELIPLQTNKQSILGNCHKVEIYKDRFYIHDRINHAIFVFDKEGEFLFNTLNQKGRGPGQYSNLMDFNINPYTENLEILDAPSRKIKLYDIDGNYKNFIPLAPEISPFLVNFKALSEDVYLFYSQFSQNRKGSLIFYSLTSGKILNKAAPLPKKIKNLSSTISNPFNFFNDQLYFFHKFPSNIVYLVDPLKLDIKKDIELNFGDHNFTLDLLPNKRQKEFYRSFILNNDNKYAFVTDIKENNEFLLVFYLFEKKIHVVKYNKTTKELQLGHNLTHSIGQLPVPNLLDNNYLYFFSEPSYVKYVISTDLLDNNSNDRLKRIKEDDNPIIVKYKLK
jgi:hypothetical protein